MSERDDFPEGTKRLLAERVNYLCSYHGCRAQTTGPHSKADKRVSVGMAAHITAAAEGGPRFDRDLSSEQRKAPENGIWMCASHGTLVDRDEAKFSVDLLQEWKAEAEGQAFEAIGRTGRSSPSESLIPTLSDRLKAPRPARPPESMAMNLLWGDYKFYLRVVRLIEDIGRLPNNAITNIYRGAEYDRAKSALLSKFGEDYSAFQSNLKKAIDLLELVIENSCADKDELVAIISATREVATTVASLVAWSQDRRNEPVNLGTLHTRPAAVNDARNASITLYKLVGTRMMKSEL